MPAEPFSSVTLRDIARVAGVHVTTVSLALRNSTQISVKTRRRLQKLAEKMHYRPNPLVVAFVQQRRTSRSQRFQGVMAFINQTVPGEKSQRENPYIVQMFQGAAKHARELGFKLEWFETTDYGNDPVRLEKTLHARNIRGLLFPPPRVANSVAIPLNWEHFATVMLTTSFQTPLMDRVSADHFEGSRLALRTCWERGYRRPGYFSLASTDERTQGRWRGGFLAYTSSMKSWQRVPALVAPDDQMVREFQRWYQRWKPDVLVSIELTMEVCQPAIEAMGVSIPRDVAAMELNIRDPKSSFSGVSSPVEVASATAVDLLASKLYINRLGLPEHPKILQTPPSWHEGITLPVRSKLVESPE